MNRTQALCTEARGLLTKAHTELTAISDHYNERDWNGVHVASPQRSILKALQAQNQAIEKLLVAVERIQNEVGLEYGG